MSIGKYAYGYRGREVYAHQYVPGNVTLETEAGKLNIALETGYPYEGEMRFTLSQGSYAMNLRIPGYCKGKYALTLNGEPVRAEIRSGYARIEREWAQGDRLTLSLSLVPYRVYANPRVRADIGKVALMRGPLVFCLEQADNGAPLAGIALNARSELKKVDRPDKLGGIVEIHAQGTRPVPQPDATQYLDEPAKLEPTELIYIPYYAWANRGEGEMSVWIHEF